jgi:hypothetical protein
MAEMNRLDVDNGKKVKRVFFWWGEPGSAEDQIQSLAHVRQALYH